MTTETPAANSSWPCLTALQWGRGLVTTETNYRPGETADDVLLQWGRGLVTTETTAGGVTTTTLRVLQWGRGLVTTETRDNCRFRSRLIRFNGAVVW